MTSSRLPSRLYSRLFSRPWPAALAVAALLGAGCTTLPAPPAEPAEPAAPAVVAVAPEPPAAASAPAQAVVLAPMLPRTRLDPAQDAQRLDLWQRVRDGFVLVDLDNDLVRRWEQFYARDPAYVQRMAERGSRYLFYIVEEVQRRGMPTELALLPFIESAFNPQARSRVAASGMWQFMPATGKDFDLHQNLFRDDRRDVLASTRAALDYLQRLYGMFNDWPLALAAYNWGQGNVTKALERNRRAGLPEDYVSLTMPNETREYVPKLQAMKNIVSRPEAFALGLPPLQNHPYFLSVPIERDIDVALAARLSGLTLEEFQQLNPQMNKPVILAAGTPQVLLPYDNANRFVTALSQHRGNHATWTAWVAPRTVSAAEAARLIGMSEEELREVNHIPPRMVVKAGSTLLVPREDQGADVSEHLADNALLAFMPEAQPLRRLSFKAGRRGDTVLAVARRYRVTPALVARWNGLSAQARFAPGQVVVVMLPQKAKAGAAVYAKGKSGAAPRAAKVEPVRVAKTAAPARAAKAGPARAKARPAPRVRVAQAGARGTRN